jgi:dihydroorotate dehydrogenase
MNLFNLFKTVAFRLDPEKVHDLSLQSFSKYPQLSNVFPKAKRSNKYAVKTTHMKWDFPVGLAAGLDKNALALDFFSQLGFGAVELGTVTLRPQAGNPKPRIWRYPDEENLRNAMGFPNHGAEVILERLKKYNNKAIIGVNIGKNKDTSKEDAPSDYARLYEMFAPHCQYMAINVSSPNTPGLREFQSENALKEIFSEIEPHRRKVHKPLYLKIAPDLPLESLEDIVKSCVDYRLSGIISTNTTIVPERGKGGMSGRILTEKSKTVRNKLLSMTRNMNEFDIIGVGGISSFADVLDFWRNGGKYTQIYTSFVFQGPQILKDIQDNLDKVLDQFDLNNLEELLSYPELLQKL